MASIFELFPQKDILDYVNSREYPALLGESLFPERKTQSLDFKMIKGSSGAPVAARTHAFDTEADIGQREAQVMEMSLSLIKEKLPLYEKDIIALENPRNDAELSMLRGQVFNDFESLVRSVRTQVENYRMQALANGTITLDGNGLSGEYVDYQVPTEHQQALSGTSLWSDDAASPLDDIDRWQEELGGTATRALTSRAALNALLSHPEVTKNFTNLSGSISRQDLNTFLTSRDLPAIAVYDQQFRTRNAAGGYTSQRYFPKEKFVMFSEGTLGETIYGATAEEIRLLRKSNIDAQMFGNVFAGMYEENNDPVSTWTKAAATVLPSFPSADEVFQATVIGG